MYASTCAHSLCTRLHHITAVRTTPQTEADSAHTGKHGAAEARKQTLFISQISGITKCNKQRIVVSSFCIKNSILDRERNRKPGRNDQKAYKHEKQQTICVK